MYCTLREDGKLKTKIQRENDQGFSNLHSRPEHKITAEDVPAHFSKLRPGSSDLIISQEKGEKKNRHY